jgi:hypothetical protein
VPAGFGDQALHHFMKGPIAAAREDGFASRENGIERLRGCRARSGSANEFDVMAGRGQRRGGPIELFLSTKLAAMATAGRWIVDEGAMHLIILRFPARQFWGEHSLAANVEDPFLIFVWTLHTTSNYCAVLPLILSSGGSSFSVQDVSEFNPSTKFVLHQENSSYETAHSHGGARRVFPRPGCRQRCSAD